MPSPIAAAGGGGGIFVVDGTPGRRFQGGAGGGRIMRRSAAGPTMSPSTAPASTEASCCGSPTRMRRASGRTASASFAICDSETIEVSSTTTTSCGSRFPR